MGRKDTMDTHNEQALRLLLEPERMEEWLAHLAACGFEAEMAWRAKPEERRKVIDTSGGCIARIRLHKSPINMIEIIKPHVVSESSLGAPGNRKLKRRIQCEERFMIELGSCRIVTPPRAQRRAKRAFWIVGRVVGYQWHGKDFADELAAERTLNRALDKAGEEKIIINYNRHKHRIEILRPYTGTAQGVEMGGLPDPVRLDSRYHLPSPEALTAYEHLARLAKAYAGVQA